MAGHRIRDDISTKSGKLAGRGWCGTEGANHSEGLGEGGGVASRVSHFCFLFFSLRSETKRNRNRFASFSLCFTKLKKIIVPFF